MKLFLMFVFCTSSVFAEEYATTHPVFSEHLVESSSTDVLLRDRYSKVQSQQMHTISSSGGLSENIDSHLPYTVTHQKTPGTQSSFVGFGRGSSETNVQTLGVPLNPAQGGGFDLGSFPSFLFSSTRYQIGPSVGAYDPQGIGGTLSLKLWSDDALSDPAGQKRITSTGSTSGVAQFSAGASYGGSKNPDGSAENSRFAANVGASVGKMKGPAGSFSGRWGKARLSPGQIQGKYHLLASRMDSKTPGSKTFSTPEAHQVTQRLVPVFELNYLASEDWIFKSTVFYDATVLKNEDIPSAQYSRDTVKQGGTEVVALHSAWMLSGGVRDIDYQSIGFGQKNDQNYHFGAAYRFSALAHEWQPALRAVGQSDQGLKPAASVGVRHDHFDEPGLQLHHYAKFGYQPKFASLLDRYYTLNSSGYSFKGNPDLKPEDSYSASVGAEYKQKRIGASIDANYQQRREIQINETVGFTTTPQNRGDAWLASVMPTLSIYPCSFFDAHHSAVWNWSHIDQTKSEIPYLTRVSRVSRFVLHEPGLDPFWLLEGTFRSAMGSYVSPTQRTSGYGIMDLELTIALKSLKIFTKVDNITDRIVEWVPDYPGPGRVYSIGLTALF